MIKSEYSFFPSHVQINTLDIYTFCVYKYTFIQLRNFPILFNKKRIMLYLLFCNSLLSLFNLGHFSLSVYIALPHLFWELCYILSCGCAIFYPTIPLVIDPDFLWTSVCSWMLFGPNISKKGHSFLWTFSMVTVGQLWVQDVSSVLILRRDGEKPISALWRITSMQWKFKGIFVSAFT